MTVSTETSRNTFTFDGVTTVFPFTFRINDEDKGYIKLYEDGVLMSPSLYSITVNANGVGGNITFSVAPGAPAPDTTVGTAIRELPYTQGLDIRDGEGFDEAAIENAFDRGVILSQQLKDLIARSLSLPLASSISPSVEAPTADEQVMYYDLASETIKWSTVSALYASAGTGEGDVVGPSGASDNAVALFDGTTGRVIKDSGFSLPSISGKGLQNLRVNSGGTGLEAVDATPSTLTISSGSITPSKPMHIIAPEGAAPDDLTTIVTTGVEDGHQLVLLSDGGGNAVTVKNSGNINTYDGADFVIEDGYYITLVRNGTDWHEIGRFSAATGEQTNSSEYTPSAGGTITWAHGQAAVPKTFFALLRCATADNGYSVNDYVVPVHNIYDSGSGGAHVIYATGVNVVFKNAATYGIFLPNRSTFTHTLLTMARWRVTMVARS